MVDRPDHEPEVRDNPAEHRFEIWSDGELAGFSVYEPRVAVRAFVHTEIDERFTGRGLGSVLVRGALTELRAAGTPVLPFCPFVRRYIERHREFLDLVPADARARFGLATDVGSAST